jgi:hypothetical protein
MSLTRSEPAAAPPGCAPGVEGCSSVAPAPAQQFLRQALGSNAPDMQLPALLLTLALLAAVVGWLLRARRRAAGSGDDSRP